MTVKLSNKHGEASNTAPMRYIRLPEVLDRTGASWITIYRWEKQGRFPRRRKLGHRLVGWVEAEVDAWCAAKAGTVVSAGEE